MHSISLFSNRKPLLVFSCVYFSIQSVGYAAECTAPEKLLVPAWSSGDPLAASSSYASQTAVFQLPYDKSAAPSALLTAQQVGSVWGLAYDPQREKLYLSAVIRRHAGLGPEGAGAIYVYNQATDTLEAGAINIPNVGTVPDNVGRGLSGSTQLSHDEQAFDLVGKASLGDIDIDVSNNVLYSVNLNDRKIYSVDLNNANPSAAALATDYPMPSCTDGEFRPWALKYKEGKLYLGGVCSAEGQAGAQDQSNLNASVLAYDVAASTWSTALSFNLDYPRQSPYPGKPTGWYPWLSNSGDVSGINHSGAGERFFAFPTPILADIEFADDGHMIVGFADRTAMQFGARNYGSDTSNSSTMYYAVSGGDVLKATPAASGFNIEAISSATDEFYKGDEFPKSGEEHREASFGGLAVLSGKNEVVMSALDPENTDSSGVYWLDTTDGSKTQTVELLRNTNPAFGKAAGLGDMEIITCTTPPEPSETDLNLSKTVDKNVAVSGDQLVYTLTVTNESTVTATNVVVEDHLPTGVTWVSDDSAGNYDTTNGQWAVGDIPASESRVLKLTVRVD